MNDNSQKRLLLSLAVTIVIFIAEALGGILSQSLALLSDAGHVLTDAFALGLSLIALLIMKRPSDYKATYGYQRIGLLAALINGISLVVIAIFIFIEAFDRFHTPPEINSSVMLSIAAAGFVGNLIMAWILGHKHHDLNMKSVWLHVLGDTVSSAGVIIAGLIIKFTGWVLADTIASGIVGCMIIIGGVRVIKEALWIFLELSPIGFNADEISEKLSKIEGVINIHDVHIWSIGHGTPAFSAHVQIHDQKISEADTIRREIEHLLEHTGIRHSVIQIECAECESSGLYCSVKRSTESGHHH
jgi:cobalt-zinc-cadmium efflux system protein